MSAYLTRLGCGGQLCCNHIRSYHTIDAINMPRYSVWLSESFALADSAHIKFGGGIERIVAHAYSTRT